jgi:hypothetical protein
MAGQKIASFEIRYPWDLTMSRDDIVRYLADKALHCPPWDQVPNWIPNKGALCIQHRCDYRMRQGESPGMDLCRLQIEFLLERASYIQHF